MPLTRRRQSTQMIFHQRTTLQWMTVGQWISNHMPNKVWDEIIYPFHNSTPDLVSSPSCKIGCGSYCFVLKFDRYPSSNAVENPIIFLGDQKYLDPNIAAS